MHKNGNEPVKILETERLCVRHLCVDDADFIVELLNELGIHESS